MILSRPIKDESSPERYLLARRSLSSAETEAMGAWLTRRKTPNHLLVIDACVMDGLGFCARTEVVSQAPQNQSQGGGWGGVGGGECV